MALEWSYSSISQLMAVFHDSEMESAKSHVPCISQCQLLEGKDEHGVCSSCFDCGIPGSCRVKQDAEPLIQLLHSEGWGWKMNERLFYTLCSSKVNYQVFTQ